MSAALRVTLATLSVGPKPVGRNVAIRNLRAWCRADPGLASRVTLSLVEDGLDLGAAALADRILAQSPDVLGLSCYVWNSPTLLAAAARVCAARPHIRVLLGGPDASTRAPLLMDRHAWVDGVVLDEGEDALRLWLRRRVGADTGPVFETPGWTTRGPDGLRRTPALDFIDLDALPSLLDAPEGLPEGTLTLESSRGCRYPCAYCLYNYTGRRARSVARLLDDVSRYSAMGGGPLYLVDAGLDHDRPRMRTLLAGLARFDNIQLGHIEMQIEDLEPDDIDALALVRPPLAIGLQTTHPPTAGNVRRPYRPAKLRAATRSLVERRLRFHLDVIYGLPGDDLRTFCKTLDDGWALGATLVHPMRLQLLPGSPLSREVERWGFVADSEPPYAVRSCDSFSAADLDRAHTIAQAAHAVHTGTFDHGALRLGASALGVRPTEWLAELVDGAWGSACPLSAETFEEWQRPERLGDAVAALRDWLWVSFVSRGRTVPSDVADAFALQFARAVLQHAPPSPRRPAPAQGWTPTLLASARVVRLQVARRDAAAGRSFHAQALVRTSAGVVMFGMSDTLADLVCLCDGRTSLATLFEPLLDGGEPSERAALSAALEAALRGLVAQGVLG